MELQNARARFEKQGVGLAAISYDSRAILKDFADRHKIEFPLLADADSQVIRSFNVLNSDAKGMTRGMAHPGFFYIDENGVIREKYFEAQYADRFTPNNVIGKLFPELSAEVSESIDAPHLRLTLEQSDRVVAPGNRVTVIANIELPPGVHVYSPGVQGYKPIQLSLYPVSGVQFSPVTYPSSKTLYLEAINEKVPVFEGKFKIAQDVTVNASKARDGLRAVLSAGKTASIVGDLQYQACDQAFCYTPSRCR